MQVLQPTSSANVYNLSSGKSVPQWLTSKKRRQLERNDTSLRKRIELIQSFEMPTVSHCLTKTPDRQYILAAGAYKPRVRCFQLDQLSVKFDRCVDVDISQLLSLSDDYSKFVALQGGRYVEFHSQFGRYTRLRLPSESSRLAYYAPSAHLHCAADDYIWRLDLEAGRFTEPLRHDAGRPFCYQLQPQHQLLVAGGRHSLVAIDPRKNRPAATLDCQDGVSAVEWRTHVELGVGTLDGRVLLYDVRSPRLPLNSVAEHAYGLPIRNIVFVNDNLVSVDRRIVRITDLTTNELVTWIEPADAVAINDCLVFDGLLMLACETPKMLTYYVPRLGAAPRWCSFLDALAEELVEEETSVYDDFAFVSRDELVELGLTPLLGTEMLRAAMHGFFVDRRLIKRRRVIATETPQKPVEAQTKKPAAERVLDDRFAALLTDPDFALDEVASSETKPTKTPATVARPESSDDEPIESSSSDEEDNQTTDHQPHTQRRRRVTCIRSEAQRKTSTLIMEQRLRKSK